jgi:hypothetical protein
LGNRPPDALRSPSAGLHRRRADDAVEQVGGAEPEANACGDAGVLGRRDAATRFANGWPDVRARP